MSETPRTDAACKRAAEIAAKTGTGELGMYGALQESMEVMERELMLKISGLQDDMQTIAARRGNFELEAENIKLLALLKEVKRPTANTVAYYKHMDEWCDRRDAMLKPAVKAEEG